MLRIDVSEMIPEYSRTGIRALDTSLARKISQQAVKALESHQSHQTVLLSFDGVKEISSAFLFQAAARVHLLHPRADRDFVVVGLAHLDMARLEGLIKEAKQIREVLQLHTDEPVSAIA